MTVVAEKIVYNIGPWAQSYKHQIPENFRFSEPKFLIVTEATILVEKSEKFRSQLNQNTKKNISVFKPISLLYKNK